MRNDEHQKGGCDIHAAKFESDQLLQGTVHNHYKQGDDPKSPSCHGQETAANRFQMSALDAQGLEQTSQMAGEVLKVV